MKGLLEMVAGGRHSRLFLTIFPSEELGLGTQQVQEMFLGDDRGDNMGEYQIRTASNLILGVPVFICGRSIRG